jgi:hypothetical protein
MVGTLEKIRAETGAVILAIGLILLILMVFGIIRANISLASATTIFIVIGAGLLWHDYMNSKSSK